jgi:hypothetical protein
MKRFDFFVPGPLPGLNDIIDASKTGFFARGKRSKRMFEYTLMARRWTKAVGDHIYIGAKGDVPEFDYVQIVFKWLEKNKKRDPDNIAASRKFILDGMVKVGLIPTDGWRHIHSWDDYFMVSADPGVFVSVMDRVK